MVMTPDWESVGCEFKYGIFWKERPGLISLIRVEVEFLDLWARNIANLHIAVSYLCKYCYKYLFFTADLDTDGILPEMSEIWHTANMQIGLIPASNSTSNWSKLVTHHWISYAYSWDFYLFSGGSWQSGLLISSHLISSNYLFIKTLSCLSPAISIV